MIRCAFGEILQLLARDPPPLELRRSPRTGLRVHDDAVADDRRDVRVQDAGRDEAQLVDLLADDDRVAGVVPALIADDEVDLGASRSVTLPLPSSPHWAPTTTVTGTGDPLLSPGDLTGRLSADT